MDKKSKGWKISAIYSILTMILLIALTGCSSLDTIQELKRQPEIMDVSINYEKTVIDVGVFLNSNVDTTEAKNLGEKYALIVKQNYKDRGINLRIIKNKEQISSYSIQKSE